MERNAQSRCKSYEPLADSSAASNSPSGKFPSERLPSIKKFGVLLTPLLLLGGFGAVETSRDRRAVLVTLDGD
ncbi:MAG TPA: hypothetical protein VM870_04985, partial [Pyrinomonadaceae bacterium]|nr:hypothetical protein [Pyrinomonadaceae bacterium]